MLEYDPTAKINDLVTKSERMDEIKGGNRLESLEDSLEAYKCQAHLTVTSCPIFHTFRKILTNLLSLSF